MRYALLPLDFRRPQQEPPAPLVRHEGMWESSEGKKVLSTPDLRCWRSKAVRFPYQKTRVETRRAASLRIVSLRLRLYRETVANNSECSSDWNFWSSVLKWTCRFALSESTLMLSIATFSIGEAFSFL